MTSNTRGNVLVVQSGGCTAVMNRSLTGVVQEAFACGAFGEVYGAVHGLDGILTETFIDLRRISGRQWARIAKSPGAALGSARRRLKEDEVPGLLKTLRRHDIGYLFTIGGNDSAETAHRIAQESIERGPSLVVVHIPKTIDNDLPATDHTPGYGSAARFVALATMGAAMDAQAMGDASPITIIEVMGRDAGWLAASSALGKRDEMDAPHFICMPEVPLDEALFLGRMQEAYGRWGFAVAVTAENVRGHSGPLGNERESYLIDQFGHEYFEGPGRYLAQLTGREMGVRARFEKPGTIQRSMAPFVSRTDAAEAAMVGRDGVRYALEGRSDYMVTLVRQPGDGYQCTTALAPVEEVAGKVKVLPPQYIDASQGLVTKAFVEYARPLIGGPLPRYVTVSQPPSSRGRR